MKYALIALVIYLVWRKMSSGYEPACKVVWEPCPPSYIEKGGICMSTGFPFKFLPRKSRAVCEEPTKVAEKSMDAGALANKDGMKIGSEEYCLRTTGTKNCGVGGVIGSIFGQKILDSTQAIEKGQIPEKVGMKIGSLQIPEKVGMKIGSISNIGMRANEAAKSGEVAKSWDFAAMADKLGMKVGSVKSGQIGSLNAGEIGISSATPKCKNVSTCDPGYTLNGALCTGPSGLPRIPHMQIVCDPVQVKKDAKKCRTICE
jgi:hypothetical protein